MFSERLIAPMSGGELIAAAMPGRPLTRPMRILVSSSIVNNGNTLLLTPRQRLAPGNYRLNWHAVSVDTHRVQGTLSFKIK